MKLLFTGGTGFLGQNIKHLLERNYEITTCGITSEDIIKSDLANDVPFLPEKYDVVLHACGKAHTVPRNEVEKELFFDVNFKGSVNICKALEKVGAPKSMIFISTEHFDNVKFLLAGWADDSTMKELQSLSGWTNVEFLGRVSKDQVVEKVYNKADIGVAIYHYCPLCRGKVGNLSNNKLFEYMYAGLPILCTDYDLWTEIIEKYNLGCTATPGNVDSVVSGIKNLIKDIYPRYGEQGPNAVITEYNWKAQEQLLLQVYKNL